MTTQFVRKFKLGLRIIDDPAPTQSFADKIRILQRQFKQFRWTTILEEDGELQADGQTILYTLQLPPVKVNG